MKPLIDTQRMSNAWATDPRNPANQHEPTKGRPMMQSDEAWAALEDYLYRTAYPNVSKAVALARRYGAAKAVEAHDEVCERCAGPHLVKLDCARRARLLREAGEGPAKENA